jgi:hypothetical protein
MHVMTQSRGMATLLESSGRQKRLGFTPSSGRRLRETLRSMIGVTLPRIKQEDKLVPRSHQNRGLLELTARLKRQPRSALVDKSGGTGPTAVIGGIDGLRRVREVR